MDERTVLHEHIAEEAEDRPVQHIPILGEVVVESDQEGREGSDRRLGKISQEEVDLFDRFPQKAYSHRHKEVEVVVREVDADRANLEFRGDLAAYEKTVGKETAGT